MSIVATLLLNSHVFIGVPLGDALDKTLRQDAEKASFALGPLMSRMFMVCLQLLHALLPMPQVHFLVHLAVPIKFARTMPSDHHLSCVAVIAPAASSLHQRWLLSKEAFKERSVFLVGTLLPKNV